MAPAQMQGMLMNMRKPMFQDPRVRHALTMAFDYDWMNRMMFYGQYRRTSSYFEASPFGATGMPSPKELALLDPLKGSVPPEVFGPMLKQPDTIAPNTLRGNLRVARDLLAQAGWHYRDGALRDANGTPMTIEIMDDQPGMDRLILPYMQALGMLGIQAHMREIDSALYEKRLDNFEYDMTTFIYPPVTIPGSELTRRFGSAAAAEVGSENYPGIRSKAIDSLIHSAISADNLDDLEAATRALDRVLIYSFYLVPEYYAPAARRIGYKSTLGYPAKVPTSYQYEDWVIDYWYTKAPAAQTASSHHGYGPLRHSMLAYILRRLLLMVPTLLGVVTLTFVVTQFVPGGPVEQVMTQLRHGCQPWRRGGGGRWRLSRQPGRRSPAARTDQEAVRLRQAAARTLCADAQALRDFRSRPVLLPA